MTNLSWRARLLRLPRRTKQASAFAFDVVLAGLCAWASLAIRFDDWMPDVVPLLKLWFTTVLIATPIFVTKGLYRAVFRYSGYQSIRAMYAALSLYALIHLVIFTLLGIQGAPRSMGLLQPMLFAFCVVLSRLAVQALLEGLPSARTSREPRRRTLIYGAGSAGRQLVSALGKSSEHEVVGYLDDDDRLHGQHIDGIEAFNPANLPSLVRKLNVKAVLLAIPSATRQRRALILSSLQSLHVEVRSIPSLDDLTTGRVVINSLRELDIEDLLGRDPVPPNALLMGRNIQGKTVAVTGAGGSIGSELCRQILNTKPKRLLLIESSEFALYTIHQELQSLVDGVATSEVEVIPLLANVQDRLRMSQVFAAYNPHTVYHAAAYKHVPLVEHNPTQGVANNVFGTLVTAQEAARAGAQDFVLVSTDKAVRPTNIMGASKRLAELVLQGIAAEQEAQAANQMGRKTRFSMVRFGNVLGSSGSVVPLFRSQIQAGGPVTLTDERITRYFMTIPEAAQLVIQAGAMASGGEVFVLDMGDSVRILDLARRMIELSGLTLRDETHPDGDIEIAVTGLRPGEKLFEELLIGDNPQATRHPRIMKANEALIPWLELQAELKRLDDVVTQNDIPALRALLKRLVSGYDAHEDIVDWIHATRESQSSALVA